MIIIPSFCNKFSNNIFSVAFTAIFALYGGSIYIMLNFILSVDKEEVLDIIKEIRLKLPDELKQAKWVKEERQKILVQAQNEADDIIKEAENRIISMIDEHEITRKAYEKKVEIIETANEMSREISKGTKEYADNVLAGIEVALEDALKVIRNNRKELK